MGVRDDRTGAGKRWVSSVCKKTPLGPWRGTDWRPRRRPGEHPGREEGLSRGRDRTTGWRGGDRQSQGSGGTRLEGDRLGGVGGGGQQEREGGTGKGLWVWPSGESGRRRNSPAFWKDREAQWGGEVFEYGSLLARREPPPGAGSAKPSTYEKAQGIVATLSSLGVG